MARINPNQLESCKKYMGVDFDYDDETIESLMETAVDYLTGAGIPESWSRKYELAVKRLTLHWYDSRNDIAADKPMPLGLRPLINQLKAESFVDSASGA